MGCVRVALRHKFVLGSLLVAGVAVGLRVALASGGFGVAPWLQLAMALLAGGALGFVLSGRFASNFGVLGRSLDQMRRGDFSASPELAAQPTFPDETSARRELVEETAAK